ncbi:MAG: MtaA/CmuA family methyltransferase [Candidatus Methanomethylicus sp.]|nr:MtaA/CmuA family methyltransferase [Candidatus Methanomethylicus sp.]
MKDYTQRERLISVIAGNTVDKTPVVSFTQTATLEMMKASNAYWPPAHRDAQLMADLAVASHMVAGLEAVRLPFGLTGEAATMGCHVNYHEDKSDFTPTVEMGLSSYDDLKIPEPNDGIMGQIMSAVQKSREIVGNNIPIIVGVTGPFTIAGHIRGVNDILTDIILNQALVHKILATTWQVSANFANALVGKGADVVAFIEPTASIIGADFFKEFCLPYMKKVTAEIKAPTVLHICGDSLPIMDMMAETGVSAVSVDQKVNIAKAKEVLNGRCRIVGNVDPVAILQMKKPEGVVEDCRRILSEGTDALAPGCGISPYTPTENIKAMIMARDNYY